MNQPQSPDIDALANAALERLIPEQKKVILESASAKADPSSCEGLTAVPCPKCKSTNTVWDGRNTVGDGKGGQKTGNKRRVKCYDCGKRSVTAVLWIGR